VNVCNTRKLLCAAAIGGLAGTAHAQSSVTLYGLIDGGISYVNHAENASGGSSSLVKFDDGINGGNRWGLKGAEDLGGGYKAIFTLENGFGLGDGTLSQGGALFGRQAFVGISKSGVGAFTMGRQYPFAHDYLNRYSTGGLTAGDAYMYHINTLDLLTSVRINNSVKFDSVRMYGFKFGAMYGFSNAAGQFGGSNGVDGDGGSSRTYSFGVDYRNGPFSMGFAYTDITYPLQEVPPLKLTLANLEPLGERDLRSYGVGAKYQFGPALGYALWTNTRLENLDHSAATLNIYEGGVVYQVNPAIAAALGYTRTQVTGSATGTWNQVNSSVEYSLSKRTSVYVLAIYQKASGSNDGVPVQAQIGKTTSYFGNSGSDAQNQLAFRIGMRHRF
jgi:predicted porin